jgi:hypothetical protein
MMEFAELHVEEEEQPFEDQERAGPEKHGSGKEVDRPQVNMARTESAYQKAHYADDQEIAQDIRCVDTVVGLGGVAVPHESPSTADKQSTGSSCRFNICLAEILSLV